MILGNIKEARLKFSQRCVTAFVNKKNFQDEELPYKLFLTTRETSKIKNSFATNISKDVKLTKAQISKIIQSGGCFASWLGNLFIKALINVAIPLARNDLSGLGNNLGSNAINKFERKIKKELSQQEKDSLYLF